MADANSNPAAPGGKKECMLIALDFKHYDIKDALLRLLALEASGELTGLVFAARVASGGDKPYRFGRAGRLRDNQAEAIGAAVLLQHALAEI